MSQSRFMLTTAALGFGGLALGLQSCIYNVDAGYRGLIFDRLRNGIQPVVKGEGTHFYIPVVQRPIMIDARTVPREIKSVSGTKDLQQVKLILRLLSRPVVERLPDLYQEYGPNFNDVIFKSVGNEVLKAVVAQYNADQLLTQREEVSRRIKDALNERCKEKYLHLDDVALTHLKFGTEFSKAIEDKQVAEQRAERAKFIVAKAEQEKAARIIRSEGESQAADLVSNALDEYGSGMLKLRQIETAQTIAQTLSTNHGIVYLPKMSTSNEKGSGGLLLNIK